MPDDIYRLLSTKDQLKRLRSEHQCICLVASSPSWRARARIDVKTRHKKRKPWLPKKTRFSKSNLSTNATAESLEEWRNAVVPGTHRWSSEPIGLVWNLRRISVERFDFRHLASCNHRQVIDSFIVEISPIKRLLTTSLIHARRLCRSLLRVLIRKRPDPNIMKFGRNRTAIQFRE